MSKNAPRRPSRTTTPRPRKIAGKDPASTETDPSTGAREAVTPPPAVGEGPATPTALPASRSGQDVDAPATSLASESLSRALLVLVGVFALLLVLQGLWFYLHGRVNDDRRDSAQASQSDDEGDAPIAVPSDRPVVLNQLAVQEGVEAAAAAAQTILGRNWESYDDGVDNAITLMTDDFAEEYRATTDDVRREFIADKTDVQIHIVGQGVVRANDTELEALLFLNQYTFKDADEDGSTTYTPYRVVVTMVHTDEGWLVDGLQTK